MPESLNRVHWPVILQRYAVGLVTTFAAIWARSLLQPWLKEECPFSLFYLSVLLTAWMAGTGPAIMAVVLGTVSAAHFFIPPESSLLIEEVPDVVQLVIYVFVNCVAIFLYDRANRQRTLAENRSSENERLTGDLRQADIRKDEFLALLAHELRNPLAPIRSSLALLERKEESPAVVNRVRRIIQRQTTHLIRITDDLLDVSRFCRGKVELQVETLDLRLPIQDAIEMIEDSFASRKQRFNSLIPSDPIWICGDRVRVAQLVANLLGNASKYTPESGRITLSIEPFDESVSIAVTDNGIGFSQTQADQILEPFVQIDASRTREYGGLGVGLTIVSRLVALHAGTLNIESRGPGMGSCFRVTLPTTPLANKVHDFSSFDDEDRVPVPLGKPAHSGSPANSGSPADPGDNTFGTPAETRPRLLLVEDNQDASAILAELFESEGYHVELAFEGVEAIQKAHALLPDVIIMDIGLPGMDGYEIARRLRRSKVTKNLKLIALTGWGGTSDRELADDAGFDLHLIKPIAFRELLDHVMTTLGSPRTTSRTPSGRAAGCHGMA